MDYENFGVMSAANLLDRTVEYLKQTFWYQAAASMLFNFIAVAIISMAVFATILFTAGLFTFNVFDGVPLSGMAGFSFVVLFILFVLFFIFFGSVLSLKRACCYELARQAYAQEPKQLGAAIGFAFGKIPALISAAITKTIIYAPFIGIGMALFYHILTTPYVLFSIFQFGSVLNIRFIVLMIVFVVLIYVIFVFLSLIEHISIYERVYFLKAAIKSFRMVRKNFASIAGVHIIFALVYLSLLYSVAFLLSLAGSLLIGLFALSWEGMIMVIYMFIQMFSFVFNILMNFVINTMGSILSQLIYMNQRIRYEGYDIELSLNKVIYQWRLSKASQLFQAGRVV